MRQGKTTHFYPLIYANRSNVIHFRRIPCFHSRALKTDFLPFVPRVLLRWQHEEPDALHRALAGTLTFADLSGFTKMSERLSRKGKVGAEEVTGAIDQTFFQLLQIANEEGGELLKFGGDALLLFFSAPNHPARACRAAVRMRTKLREIGRLDTSGGIVTLRMSVGLHSGEFNFFLVGDSHRELIITGPGATETAEMESSASAGEILISPATAQALGDPSLLGAARGRGILLRASPKSTPSEAELTAIGAQIDPSRFIPTAIREHLAAGGHESEHKQVTVGFVGFGGTEELLARGRSDEVAEMLDRLVRETQSAVAHEGICFLGTDVYSKGGKIILTAGAPKASGNDQERMLRAVRAIADAMPSGLRIGVNDGHVFAGEVGTPFRRTYTIMGDAVNLAARLMQRAEPGQILTTREVLEKSRTIFHLKVQEPFTPKGKAHPIVPHSIEGIRGSRQIREARRLPLLGRERELSELLAALEAARRGRGQLVQIVGEAGVGKSRLLAELQAHEKGDDHIQVVCEQYESSTPYFALRILLSSIAGISLDETPERSGARLREKVESLSPELLPWLPLLAIPLDASVTTSRQVDELDPQFRKARLEEVVLSFIERAMPTSAVLVFEDVHWMDEASADFLNHLLRNLNREPWLVCVARRYRDRGFSPPAEVPAKLVELNPLAPADGADLVRAAAEDLLLPVHEIEALVKRSGGNPLFVQELLEGYKATAGFENLPDSIEAVIASRIDRLKAQDRALLRYASVLGPAFDRELIRLTTGQVPENEAWGRLSTFVERESPESFRFKHDLYREVAYEGLPYRRRRELHARAGTSLESRTNAPADIAEALSLHYYLANMLEKAWRSSVVAGVRAQSKFANIEAINFYRRALDVAKRLDGIGRATTAYLWEELGMVSQLAGLFDDAKRAFTSSRRSVPEDPRAQARLLYKQGQIDLRRDLARAFRSFRKALKVLEPIASDAESEKLRVRLLVSVALVRREQGAYDDSIKLAKLAMDAARASEDRAGLAHAQSLLYLIYSQLGRPERAEYRDLPLVIYEEIGDLRQQGWVLNHLANEARREGRLDDARGYFERSTKVFERSGNVWGGAVAASNRAELLTDQGRIPEAEALFREALAALRPVGYKQFVAEISSKLARAVARDGRFDEADAMLREALEDLKALRVGGDTILEIECYIAENLVLAGRYEDALSLLVRLIEEASAGAATIELKAMLYRLEAVALVHASDFEGARRAIDESEQLARSADGQYELGLTLKTRAELSSCWGEDGEAARRESEEILSTLGVVAVPRVPVPS